MSFPPFVARLLRLVARLGPIFFVAAARAGAASAPAGAYQPWIKPYAEDAGAVFSIASYLVASIAFIGLLALAWREWRRDPLIIEPFDVPKELQDLGLTGGVLSQQLSDTIVAALGSARIDDGAADIAFVELPRLQVDLQLPGTAWSLRGAVRYLKQVRGRNERRMVGEVFRQADAYAFRLRGWTGRAIEVATRFRSAADLPPALRRAAEETLVLANPLEGASVLFSVESPRSGYPRTLAAIRLHLATEPARTHQDAYVAWASVCRALGDVKGMRERLELARLAAEGRPRPRYHNFQGSLDREQGRRALAEAAFRAALRRDPHNIGALANLGLVQLEMRRYDLARESFRRLIARAPTSSRGYRGMGLIAQREGDGHGAVRWHTRAIDIAPLARWPRVNRIEALRWMGELDAAEAQIRTFLERDADFAPLHRFHAQLLADREEAEAAVRSAQRAVEIDAADAWNHVELARRLAALARPAEALAAAERALALRPAMPEPWRVRSQVLRASGDFEGAERALREGAAADPLDLWCLLELSDQQRRRGLHEAALEAAAAALGRHPGDPDPLRRMAWVHRDRGEWSAAIARLEEALRWRPADAPALLDLSDVQRRQGRHDLAVATAGRAVQTRLRIGRAHHFAALALAAAGHHDEALGRWRRAMADDPGDAEPPFQLARFLYGLERHDEALEVLEALVARWPAKSAIWRMAARVLLDLGDSRAAVQRLHEAARRAPHDVDNAIGLAELLLDAGLPDEALAQADRACELRADLATAWRCRARVLDSLGNHEAALSDWRQAVAAAPGDVWRWNDLVVALRRRSRWSAAATAVAVLMERRPLASEGPLAAAETAWARGDEEAALRHYEHAVALAPVGESWPRRSRARFLNSRRRHALAVAELQQVLDAEPLQAEAQAEMVEALARGQGLEQALAWIEARGSAATVEASLRLARVAIRAEGFDEAVQALTAGLQRWPQSLRLRRELLEVRLCEVELRMDEADDARREATASGAPALCAAFGHAIGEPLRHARRLLDDLTDRLPHETRDLLRWARAFAHRDPWRAGPALQRAAQRQPGSVPVQLMRVEFEPDPSRAGALLRKLVTASPWALEPVLELAQRLMRAGRSDEASTTLRAAQARWPGHFRVLAALARALHKSGTADEAQAVVDRLRAVAGDSDPGQRLELARVLRDTGRPAEAQEVARAAALLAPRGADAAWQAARVMLDAGPPAAAVALGHALADLGAHDAASEVLEVLQGWSVAPALLAPLKSRLEQA